MQLPAQSVQTVPTAALEKPAAMVIVFGPTMNATKKVKSMRKVGLFTFIVPVKFSLLQITAVHCQ